MRQFRIFASIALIGLALTGCSWGQSHDTGYGIVGWSSSSAAGGGPAIGQRAPNFRLKTAGGQDLELQHVAGGPVVVNFFASWCTNCREEMATLESVSHAAANATIIGVDLRESASAVDGLAAETGATYPLALDSDGTVARAYRATSLPATYVLDANGVVRAIIRGPVERQDLLNAIGSAAAGTPAP